MNVKMACGKNSSLSEIFKGLFARYSWDLLIYSITGNLDRYTAVVNAYECFEYGDGKQKAKFKRGSTSNINNFNTNFNKKLAGYGLNSKYPNNIPNKKYIFLSIYGLTVIFLLITSIIDYDNTQNKGKTEQVINSIIVCLIFLIWTHKIKERQNK